MARGPKRCRLTRSLDLQSAEVGEWEKTEGSPMVEKASQSSQKSVLRSSQSTRLAGRCRERWIQSASGRIVAVLRQTGTLSSWTHFCTSCSVGREAGCWTCSQVSRETVCYSRQQSDRLPDSPTLLMCSSNPLSLSSPASHCLH